MDPSIVKLAMVLSSVNKPPNSSGDKTWTNKNFKNLGPTGGLSVQGLFFRLMSASDFPCSSSCQRNYKNSEI